MKSIAGSGIGGNVKLKGKLSRVLSCGCCDMYNFKWSERVKEANREIRQAVNTRQQENIYDTH